MINRGNVINNSFDIYPNAIIVEFFLPGEGSMDTNEDWQSLDWRSLRLVFERFQDQWYITGITHDQWTT